MIREEAMSMVFEGKCWSITGEMLLESEAEDLREDNAKVIGLEKS